MEEKIMRDMRALKWYAGLSSMAIIFLVAWIALQRKDENPHFRELDVERINIREADGNLKMVISNKARQHPGLVNYKTMSPREREAGIIFFNTSGDECGGLVYDGTQKEAGLAFSVDQFRNDQLMQLQYVQSGVGDSVRRHYGLKLWDRSDRFTLAQQVALADSLRPHPHELEKQFGALKAEGLLGVERLFAGKTDDGEVGLFIRDNKGRVRIKIFCDEQNKATILVLDEQGKVMPAL